MLTLGSNDEAQTLPDSLSQKKKNTITIKDTASQMTKNKKMTEVQVNYTILRNKCC
jgi:hypothetical protein